MHHAVHHCVERPAMQARLHRCTDDVQRGKYGRCGSSVIASATCPDT